VEGELMQEGRFNLRY